MTDRFLYAEDIARLYGLGLRQARRLLEEFEETHGPSVVGRRNARHGVRRYTTQAALDRVGPPRAPAGPRVYAVDD